MRGLHRLSDLRDLHQLLFKPLHQAGRYREVVPDESFDGVLHLFMRCDRAEPVVLVDTDAVDAASSWAATVGHRVNRVGFGEDYS